MLTIWKDMTFRDYAQGAFRMRQIGMGQTLVLIRSEVENRMQEELGVPQNRGDHRSSTCQPGCS